MKYILGFLMMALSAISFAGFVDGMLAYEKNDYGRAFLEFSPLADRGDADAQFMLGEMYYSGEGVARDVKKSADYYTKSAMQGNPKGQKALGFIYQMSGSVLGTNCDKAMYWYKKSAEQGYVPAYYSVSLIYYYQYGEDCSGKNQKGGNEWMLKAAEAGDRSAQSSIRFNYYRASDGFPKDYAKAYFWARKAAEGGWPDYLIDLARMHVNAIGTNQDIVVAYALFTLAAKDGYKTAVSARDGLEKVLNQDQIKEGFMMTREWRINTPLPGSSRTGKLLSIKKEYCHDSDANKWVWKDGGC